MKSLFGYADAISLRAGEAIAFKVSSETSAPYQAQIVRLISGDTNPAGPGYHEEEVAGAAWACPGRRQRVRAGSCLAVPMAPVLVGFELELLAWPTLPDKPGQVLASCWNDERQAGFILSLEGTDGLCLQLGDGGGGMARLALGRPVFARHWYRFRASYDPATHRARLWQEALSAQVPPLDNGSRNDIVKLGTIDAAGAKLAFAARVEGGGFAGFYNGKLEAPRLSGSGVLLGAWDFAQDTPTDRVIDMSGQERHGVLHQMPARGMTGYHWRGAARHWAEAPPEYGAIHFHDDDLDDAAWETDFTYAVPTDLPSGLYAARLTSERDEDHIPFVVRPPLGRTGGKLAFLVPTASYLAYANEHMALDSAFAERVHDHVPVFGPNDLLIAAHRELGNSLYDRHSDGSPVFCSSRRRPILNMRPKYQSWLGGGRGSGLWQLNADTHLLAWLTQADIAFDCVTDEDLDREGAAALAGYACLMTGTHPEYWSTAMRDGLDGFRAAGGRTMYMGGNGLYWRIAYHGSGSGTIEVRRGESGTAPGEVHHAFNGEYGGLWRRIGRPPNQAVGVGFAGQGFDICSYFRRLPDSQDPRAAFIFEGVADEIIGDFGLIGGGAAGIELDRTDPAQGTPAHALVLARSENHSGIYLASLETLPINCLGHDRMHPIFAEMVFYETPEEGAVFSTGSIAWAGSLAHQGFDNNVARISSNVLRRFLDPAPFKREEKQ